MNNLEFKKQIRSNSNDIDYIFGKINILIKDLGIARSDYRERRFLKNSTDFLDYDTFNSYLKCISIEKEIDRNKQKLINIYASGIVIIIKYLEDYSTDNYTQIDYEAISEYISNICQKSKMFSKYLYMLLPYLTEFEIVIKRQNLGIFKSRLIINLYIQQLKQKAIRNSF